MSLNNASALAPEGGDQAQKFEALAGQASELNFNPEQLTYLDELVKSLRDLREEPSSEDEGEDADAVAALPVKKKIKPSNESPEGGEGQPEGDSDEEFDEEGEPEGDSDEDEENEKLSKGDLDGDEDESLDESPELDKSLDKSLAGDFDWNEDDLGEEEEFGGVSTGYPAVSKSFAQGLLDEGVPQDALDATPLLKSLGERFDDLAASNDDLTTVVEESRLTTKSNAKIVKSMHADVTKLMASIPGLVEQTVQRVVGETISKSFAETVTQGLQNAISGTIGDLVEERIEKSMERLSGINELAKSMAAVGSRDKAPLAKSQAIEFDLELMGLKPKTPTAPVQALETDATPKNAALDKSMATAVGQATGAIKQDPLAILSKGFEAASANALQGGDDLAKSISGLDKTTLYKGIFVACKDSKLNIPMSAIEDMQTNGFESLPREWQIAAIDKIKSGQA